jgi:hypothetical protein
MPCENYREALIEAAAADSAPSRELRSHLDVCPSCRSSFTEELQLFAAIDSSLHTAANLDVPVSLLPGVRIRLSEQRIAHRLWLPIVATITAAAVIVLIAIDRGLERENPVRTVPVSSVASNIPPARVPVLQDVTSSSAPNSHATERKAIPQGRRVGVRQPALDTVVLVPSGQKEAVDALLLGLQRGTVKSSILVADKDVQPPQELQVSPLAIPPMEIKPLADASEESSPGSGETTR